MKEKKNDWGAWIEASTKTTVNLKVAAVHIYFQRAASDVFETIILCFKSTKMKQTKQKLLFSVTL